MTAHALRQDIIDVGCSPADWQVPDPFLIDSDALSRSCRGIEDARLRWRNAVLAVARKMLVDEGYRYFTIRGLSARTNSSAQNIYNNIGTRDDVIVGAIINYNCTIYNLCHNFYLNPYVSCLVARHKEVLAYPEYAEAVYHTIFNNESIYNRVLDDNIRRIYPFVRQEIQANGIISVDCIRLARMMAVIARDTAKGWLENSYDAETMLENSLNDGELCILGALSGRKRVWAASIA